MTKSVPGFIRSLEGSTPLERVAAGLGSAEDLAFAAEQRRRHQHWLASPAGQRFLKRQKSTNPAH